MGTLYVVATPIGNLEDISKRVLETLSKVDLVLSEDTRVTKKLLTHFGIEKDTMSYRQHSSLDTKYKILDTILSGKNIALVSDAGTPGISDPGNELIDFLSQNAVRLQIVPIPGPSAVITALSVCGFNVNKYLFLGFWPKKKAKKIIDVIKNTKLPFVYFDSPFRVIKNLKVLSDYLGGDRRVFVGRELTKMHETHYRGTLTQVINELKSEKHLKGEIVVVVE